METGNRTSLSERQDFQKSARAVLKLNMILVEFISICKKREKLMIKILILFMGLISMDNLDTASRLSVIELPMASKLKSLKFFLMS